MKLFRKASAPARRRLLKDNMSGPTPFVYRSQRSALDLNVGRQLQRPPLKKRPSLRQNFWLQRFGLVILSLVAVICLVNVLGLSSNAKLVTLNSGSQLYLHSTATYQAAVDKLLAGSIWNRNKITVNTARVSHQLSAQFPELTSVSITLPLLAHRPIVYVTAAQPAIVLQTVNGSFVLDSNGTALLKGSDSRTFAGLNLPLVTDQSDLQLKTGGRALTADNVSFIQTVAAELAAKNVAVSSLALPAGGGELDVHIAGQSYFVKFNLHSSDARQQAGTYLATISHLQAQGITPAQYIDVRVDGRAYYQ